MNCTRSHGDIQALIDGTLGPIRVAELEQHLDQCDACRALANDLRRIRDLADTLDEPVPPDHVWLQIAGRLRQEGRVHDRLAPVATGHRRLRQPRQSCGSASPPRSSWPSARRCCCCYRSSPDRRRAPARTEQGNAAGADAVQSGVEDLRKAERLLQSGVAKLKEGLGSENQALPTDMAGTLDRNLQILDQAITESSDALQKEPQNVAARNSLFEALQRKISLLQDTITLMNEMRKGNAAGVAQVVEGANKS